MKKIVMVMGLVMSVLLTACSSTEPVEQVTAPQEVYAQVFDADQEDVFPKVIKALLQAGYTVTTSDSKAGFVAAKTSVTFGNPLGPVLTDVTVQQQTLASVFVEKASGGTRVQIRLVRQEVATGASGMQQDGGQTKITNAAIYQEIFNLIDAELQKDD